MQTSSLSTTTVIKLLLVFVVSCGGAAKSLPPSPHLADWIVALGVAALPVLTFFDQSIAHDQRPQTVQVPIQPQPIVEQPHGPALQPTITVGN